MNGSSAATVTLTRAPATTAAKPAAASRSDSVKRDRRHHQREHDQIVVGAAEPVDHIQRVGPDGQQREHLVVPAPAGDAPGQDERDGGGDQRVELHPPQPADHPEQAEGVGDQRVQGAVGGGDAQPVVPDVAEHRVADDRHRAVQIGVDAVDGPHAGVGDVAEHIGGDQDRPGEHDQVQQRDERDRPSDHRPVRAGTRARAGVRAGARARAHEGEQDAVGDAGGEEGDQEHAIAESLSPERLQPGGDVRRMGDQGRVFERGVEHDLDGRRDQDEPAQDRDRRRPADASGAGVRAGGRGGLRAPPAARVRVTTGRFRWT